MDRTANDLAAVIAAVQRLCADTFPGLIPEEVSIRFVGEQKPASFPVPAVPIQAPDSGQHRTHKRAV